MLSHVSVGTNDFERARKFYNAVMPSIGAKPLMDFPGAVAYGKQYPEFWVQTPINGAAAETANGVHIAFLAADRDAVDRFYYEALAAGGTGDGEPGPRPDYGEAYYGCFVRDLDGHKIEAMFWDFALAAKPE
ncbi:MAG: VOC family protein [Hyphomicrobiales bacterium]|nr:VOC family protein [Hyphomicrobiales bacterium]